jgi:phosphatidate phosphatase LPIN
MDGPAPVQSTEVQNKITPGNGALQYGKELGEAALRAVKEEETERMGQLQDQFKATQNIIFNQTRKISSGTLRVAPDRGDEVLPVHKPTGSPPPVAALSDVVLDMAGYHSKEASDRTVKGEKSRFNFEDISASKASKAQAQLMSVAQPSYL